MNVYAHYAHEGDCPGLDYEGAERRLSAAISLPSVSGCEDPAPFLGLHRLVREGYPAISRLGSIEAIGRSLLVTVPGIDPGLPGVLLLAHLDVVPVSSPDAWERPPFSGHVDEEWIWGRGALDIKGMLVGELEAVEYLLERHGRPRRTVWLAFGHDEETASRGATAIASELAARGAHAAVALDEGVTTFSDGAPYGAPGTVVTDIGLSQKGYLDLEVSAAGRAGHSSNPFGGTSLERLCRAVARLADSRPVPELVPVVRDLVRALEPHITEEPLSSLAADPDANAAAIAATYAGRRDLAPLVTTTMAVDQVEGSSKAPNVMPADTRATINFRLLPGTSADHVLDWADRATRDLGVGLRVLHETPAGRMDQTASWGYEQLASCFERYHPGAVVVPSIVCGGTDSVRYEGVCDLLLRATPFRPDPVELARGVHGTNERISRRTFAQGLRLLVAFLERVAL